MELYNFQYCPKLVIFSKDLQNIFLCKRKGEQDYDGTFSFIGGKMEMTDETIVEGMMREKIEEVGNEFKIRLNLKYCSNVTYTKKNGSRMILPHYCAIYEGGEPILSEEYSEFRWVPIVELEKFEPKVENIPAMVDSMLYLMEMQNKEEFIQM